MQLIDFIRSLPTLIEREAFAEAVGSSIGHLRNVGYGYRPCDTALAVSVEEYTKAFGPDRTVSRKELRPDDYWRHWPDLKAPTQVKPSKRPREEQSETAAAGEG